jgi:hypothetical protein
LCACGADGAKELQAERAPEQPARSTPVEPPAPASAIPKLPRPSEISRSASAPQPAPLRIQAWDYLQDLPHANVWKQNGGLLTFEPNYQSGGAPESLAYACFGFDLLGQAPPNLVLGWAKTVWAAAPYYPDSLFVLAADFASDRWRVVPAGGGGVIEFPADGQYQDPLSGQALVCVLMTGNLDAALDLLQYGTAIEPDSVYVLPQTTAVPYEGKATVSVFAHHTAGQLEGLFNLQPSFTYPNAYFGYKSGNSGSPGHEANAADGAWSGLVSGSNPEPIYYHLGGDNSDTPFYTELEDRLVLHLDMQSAAGPLTAAHGAMFSYELGVRGQVDLALEDEVFDAEPSNHYVSDLGGSLQSWSHVGVAGLPGIRVLGPVALAELSPEPWYAGSPISLDATASFSDAPAALQSALLTPGDGSPAIDILDDLQVEFSFQNPGVYTLRLELQDNLGLTASYVQGMYVINPLLEDRIYAVPDKSHCAPGEHVRITVYCSESAYPFQYLVGARITFADGCNYVPGSLNAGAPGGGRWDVDGIWTQTEAQSLLEYGDSFLPKKALAGGLACIDFNITPIGGHSIDVASGALFSFELEVNESTSIGIQPRDGVLTTYYDGSSGTRQWADMTNTGQPGITVGP